MFGRQGEDSFPTPLCFVSFLGVSRLESAVIALAVCLAKVFSSFLLSGNSSGIITFSLKIALARYAFVLTLTLSLFWTTALTALSPLAVIASMEPHLFWRPFQYHCS
ncbi:hypothetical protein KY285_009338 [Solanum tuberosum]|nr:hypothetical protein KY285_009338 [Solanum tuberosum]